ncbi:MAG: hypothetical protein A2W91_18430 [Bacteroidetes bacterium GWF2_38_335]|nr:MAG: hypothetical protein A2W91_18430 [Bacteroidetes bacterium GWF2_38_335]OFY78218.1 MAG: hypothetical protein A2281_04635 [Bacteroidetes bacterium RIFOXYA12_FULL_38_20]HBS88618.1 hypothetical protein [Bacteroidales bacterium]
MENDEILIKSCCFNKNQYFGALHIAVSLIIVISMIIDSFNYFLPLPETMALIYKILEKLNIEQGTPIFDL